MTDLALRQLGRAASSGDPQDEARALLARVRAGALTRERLELAAHAAHRGAQIALGAGRCRTCGAGWWPWPETMPDVCPVCPNEAWARGTGSRVGSQVVGVLLAAIARAALDARGDHDGCEGAHPDLDCIDLDDALQALERWLAAPGYDALEGQTGPTGDGFNLANLLRELLWDVRCHDGLTGGAYMPGTILYFAFQEAGKLVPDPRSVAEAALVSWALA